MYAEAAPLWVCGWLSLVAEHGLKGTQGLVVVARGISRLRHVDSPRPGIEPVP